MTAPAFAPTDAGTPAARAAARAAELLPSSSPVEPGVAQPLTPDLAQAFAAGVLVPTGGSATHLLGLLVGHELVDAMAASPTPGLTVAAATQPAVDAAAAALGRSADAAQDIGVADLLGIMGPGATAVPLQGLGPVAALLISEDLLAAVVPAAAPTPAPAPASRPVTGRGIELLHGVDMELTVELGRTRMAVRDLLSLAPGDVLELDRAAGSPADLLVNGRLIARGEVVVVGEEFGLRVTQIIDSRAS